MKGNKHNFCTFNTYETISIITFFEHCNIDVSYLLRKISTA